MYLKKRYAKGVQAVQDYMDKKHRYVTVVQISECQAELLAWQATVGSSASQFPNCAIRGVDILFASGLLNKLYKFDKLLFPIRYCIIVLDTSLWPASAILS